MSGEMAFQLGLMHMAQPTSVQNKANISFNENFKTSPPEVTASKARQQLCNVKHFRIDLGPTFSSQPLDTAYQQSSMVSKTTVITRNSLSLPTNNQDDSATLKNTARAPIPPAPPVENPTPLDAANTSKTQDRADFSGRPEAQAIHPAIHKTEAEDDYPPLPPDDDEYPSLPTDEDDDELIEPTPERPEPRSKDARTLSTLRGKAHAARNRKSTNKFKH